MSFALQLKQDSSYKKPQKLFFALFGILFLIAPFYYQPNLGGEGLFIPHNSTIWIVATWIIAAASFMIYRTNEIVLPRYWFGLALMPIGAWITGFVAVNNNPTEWLVRLSAITGGYLFFLSLFQFRLTKQQIVNALIIVVLMGFIAAFFGLAQALGWSKHFSFIPFSPSQTPVGIFQQINIQTSFMVTMLVLILYIASSFTQSKISPAVTLLLIITAFFASYTVSLSGSRVGLLGIALSLPLMLISRWKELCTKKSILIGLLLTMCIGGFLGKEGVISTSNKIERSITNIGGMEGDIRWKIYIQSWEIFKESPLIGHGLGSFQKVFQERRADIQTQGITSFGDAPRFSHPHNEFIFWLVEGGALSVIGILCAVAATLTLFYKLGWRKGLSLTALLIPITLHTQVELPFYISNTPWLLFLFLLFLCHNYDKKIFSTEVISTAARTTISLSFFFISLVSSFALVNAQSANAGIVKYLQLNQSYPQNLLPALNNAYFREYATYLALRRQLFLGIKGKKLEPAKTYIQWAENSLKTVPAPQTYRDLVIAYHYLGDENNARRTLQHALSIYSEDMGLLELSEKINKESAQSPNKDSDSVGLERD
ncbi:PglL family O-oligosaccharyltransferase [Neptuniibacter caesariensis]|uniref:Probable transcriptional regulator SyrB n=1 Tax=Neptuniibacter caesariensis TaxID=207954 RepID=A0A7U8C7W4_NEPCE|nr:Wzy polymerase domain-containing protein [Neptuniibacter caesariensis]EAR61730.1 probable transcriptional regulator SyrB [Neptuniibacter caesariensis]